MGLSEFCVYTIRHSHTLKRVAESDGQASYVEGKPWVTAAKLLTQARAAGLGMPVIFSGADDWSGLIYWGLLTRIDLSPADPHLGIKPLTSYSFEALTPIVPERRQSELRLRASGKPLADRDIYPYRICITPSFLHENAMNEETVNTWFRFPCLS